MCTRKKNVRPIKKAVSYYLFIYLFMHEGHALFKT